MLTSAFREFGRGAQFEMAAPSDATAAETHGREPWAGGCGSILRFRRGVRLDCYELVRCTFFQSARIQ